MTKTTNTFKSFLRNNVVQAIVIILSVLLSFYLEQRRQVNITKQEKNYLLTDLTKTLEGDINQIEIILEGLDKSDKNLIKLLDDINNNHTLLTDREVAEILLQIQIGTSFFPQDGIFNQLIANGTFNLIENEELKSLLLKILVSEDCERKLFIIDVFCSKLSSFNELENLHTTQKTQY